jgi:HEPN domain-containing protein
MRLDQYYIPTRYPNALLGGVPSRFYDDREEAREAMELTRAVLELVEDLVGGGEASSP